VELRSHVEQQRALWLCAGAQVVVLEASLAEQRQDESFAEATHRAASPRRAEEARSIESRQETAGLRAAGSRVHGRPLRAPSPGR